MLSYLFPTRNRPDAVRRTLDRLGALAPDVHDEVGGAEVIVVDDASATPVDLPMRLANGFEVTVHRLDRSIGAAARNVGAHAATGAWLVMLDDDSWPIDAGVVAAVADADPTVAAIGADIHLSEGGREWGGLPEVIVGCGAALRRDAFLAVGGYDHAFGYYAEEYDLCAKLIAAGHLVVHDHRFRVEHAKVAAGRDMNRMLERLVRNNGWVVERYAPIEERDACLRRDWKRLEAIARTEDAVEGYRAGRDALDATIVEQRRTPLRRAAWDRFTGAAHVRDTFMDAEWLADGARLCHRGKSAEVIEAVLQELGASIREDAPTSVIGTLSPGPMMDIAERCARDGVECVAPWWPGHARVASPSCRSHLEWIGHLTWSRGGR